MLSPITLCPEILLARGEEAREQDRVIALSLYKLEQDYGYALRDSFESAATALSLGGSALGLLTMGAAWARAPQFSACLLAFLSNPVIALTLLASGAYLLYQQVDEVKSTWDRLFNSTDSHFSLTSSQTIEDVLFLSVWALGCLGTLVTGGSFAIGTRQFFRFFKDYFPRSQMWKQTLSASFKQGDAARRAFQDPDIWVLFSRNPDRNPLVNGFLSFSGRLTQATLIHGAAFLGIARFAMGVQRLQVQYKQGEEVGMNDVATLLSTFALDIFPAVNVSLYRASRGDRRYGMGPALQEEFQPNTYHDPHMKILALKRIRRAVPSLPPKERQAYLENSKEALAKVESFLEQAEGLPSLTPSAGKFSQVTHVPSNLVPEYLTTHYAPRRLPKDRLYKSQPERTAKWVVSASVQKIKEAYANGELSPLDMLDILMRHSANRNSSVFPRELHRGFLGRSLRRLARNSEERYARGEARWLEGIPIAVKDNLVQVDGVMNLGSKTSRVRMENGKSSWVVQRILELGGIPIPVGLFPSALGGDGRGAWNHLRQPLWPNLDPAGSSSGAAYVLQDPTIPIRLAVCTDTGGSVTNPSAVSGLCGITPPLQTIPQTGMVPFASFLDRVGVMGNNPVETVILAKLLSTTDTCVGVWQKQPQSTTKGLFKPSSSPPRVVYLKTLLDRIDSESREGFMKRITLLERQGYEVIALDKEWNFLLKVPPLLYPIDSYGASILTHTHPQQVNRWGEPPRRVLDYQPRIRFAKGIVALEEGLFDRTRSLSGNFVNLVATKLGDGVVVAMPASKPIPVADIQQGKAGDQLDAHDLWSMLKNRVGSWGDIHLPGKEKRNGKNGPNGDGLTLAGQLPDLLWFI